MLLDVGVGMLAALGLHQSLWLGIIFALLPDIDGVINFILHRGMSKTHRHRDLLHVPLVYIPAGALVIYFLSPAFTPLFILCSLAHFIHDSIGIGWGVQWLRPVNSDHFSFLYLYQLEGKPALAKKYVYRWKHAEIDSLDSAHGDPNWLQNIYARAHPYALSEFGVFLFALIALFLAS